MRLRRGVEGLAAPFRHVDDRPAVVVLTPAAFPLYQRMSKADRAHSLRLLAWLRGHGYDDPDLLTAALLHDCGKAAARLHVWQRTLKVLLRRLAPTWWQRLSRPASPGSWRYPFYILVIHPEVGAEWAAATGCSETVVWLIRCHEQDPDVSDPRYPLMRALQDADSVS